MLKAIVRRLRMQAGQAPSTLILAGALACLSMSAAAQIVQPDHQTVEQVKNLADLQRWQEIVVLLGPLCSRSADLDFYYGMALARLERWDQAQSAFEAGYRLAPRDARFPTELAGIAFKEKQYHRAVRLLRRVIKLNPHDSYANDFLGTVYFLDGNLEASLKYWNRAGKPEIAEIREEPPTHVSPALFDRAFAFSEASTLKLPQFLDTEERIRGLGIFPRPHFELSARKDGKFDVVFSSEELDGFGDTKLEALYSFLRGLPFSSVNPEYYDVHHEAINFVSMYRWDAQKRRICAELSGPFEHSAKYRWNATTDLRNEEWAIRDSFTGPAPVLASVNLRREVLDFGMASYASGRVQWHAGAEISHHDFRGVDAGAVLTPELLAKGYQLAQDADFTTTLLQIPERRFVLDAGGSSEAARLWSQPEESFEKLQGSLGWHWFPKAEGDDYEMRQRVRAGKTFGQAPFDELFMLGLERDNDLPMRGHIGTRDGRKGSAPLGREYFLSNWEADKNLYENGIVAVKLGPFLDTGQITDPDTELGSQKWLTDIGVQVKLRVFGSGVVFSYGKDLRSGNNALYVDVLK